MNKYTEQIKDDFPKQLISLRTSLGASQTAVATEVGITLRTYQRYESGERMPPLDVSVALASYFKVSVEQLSGLSDFPPYNEVEK